MSTGTESTMHGKLDEIAGKVKQTFGEVTHNETVANEGAAQQVKGHTEEAWGSVKSAVADTHAQNEAVAETKAHNARESAVSTAQNVKERIEETVAAHTHKG